MNNDIKDCVIELLAMQICSLALEANKRIESKRKETFFILEPETYIEACEDFAEKYLAVDIGAEEYYKEINKKLRSYYERKK